MAVRSIKIAGENRLQTFAATVQTRRGNYQTAVVQKRMHACIICVNMLTSLPRLVGKEGPAGVAAGHAGPPLHAVVVAIFLLALAEPAQRGRGKSSEKASKYMCMVVGAVRVPEMWGPPGGGREREGKCVEW